MHIAWKIPWTEEPGGLQFMRSQRVRHDRATNTHRHLVKVLEGSPQSRSQWLLLGKTGVGYARGTKWRAGGSMETSLLLSRKTYPCISWVFKLMHLFTRKKREEVEGRGRDEDFKRRVCTKGLPSPPLHSPPANAETTHLSISPLFLGVSALGF